MENSKVIGTFCEKCRNPYCICNNSLDENIIMFNNITNKHFITQNLSNKDKLLYKNLIEKINNQLDNEESRNPR